MIFKKSRIPKKTKFMQKSMKNCMFFGISILRGFWMRLGRVLRGFEEAKIRKNHTKATRDAVRDTMCAQVRSRARNSANMAPPGCKELWVGGMAAPPP